MTQKFEDINFDDPTPATCNVNVGGTKYVLHEADGAASVEYRNAMLDATELGPDGKPHRLRGLASADPVLVSRCLKTEDGKPVTLQTILAWKAEVLTRLANWVKETSGITAGESPKNEEPSTPDGSG